MDAAIPRRPRIPIYQSDVCTLFANAIEGGDFDRAERWATLALRQNDSMKEPTKNDRRSP